MPTTYTIRNKKTGEVVRYNGPKRPNRAQIEEVFRQQRQARTDQPKLEQANREREEETHTQITSGLGTSVDQWIEQHPSLAQAMQNHPYLSSIAAGALSGSQNVGRNMPPQLRAIGEGVYDAGEDIVKAIGNIPHMISPKGMGFVSPKDLESGEEQFLQDIGSPTEAIKSATGVQKPEDIINLAAQGFVYGGLLPRALRYPSEATPINAQGSFDFSPLPDIGELSKIPVTEEPSLPTAQKPITQRETPPPISEEVAPKEVVGAVPSLQPPLGELSTSAAPATPLRSSELSNIEPIDVSTAYDPTTGKEVQVINRPDPKQPIGEIGPEGLIEPRLKDLPDQRLSSDVADAFLKDLEKRSSISKSDRIKARSLLESKDEKETIDFLEKLRDKPAKSMSSQRVRADADDILRSLGRKKLSFKKKIKQEPLTQEQRLADTERLHKMTGAPTLKKMLGEEKSRPRTKALEQSDKILKRLLEEEEGTFEPEEVKKYIKGLFKPGTDVSKVRAEFGTASKGLENLPETKEFSLRTQYVEGEMKRAEVKYNNRFSELYKGLNKNEAIATNIASEFPKELRDQVFDSFRKPNGEPLFSNPTKLKDTANKLREVFDEMHSQFGPKASPSGGPVGYTTNYWPHMMKEASFSKEFLNGVKSMMRDVLGGEFKGEIGEDFNPFVKKFGTPYDPFTEYRTGNLEDIAYDPRQIIPLYTKLWSRVVYAKPLVEWMRNFIKKNVPEGTVARESAEFMTRSMSRSEEYPNLSEFEKKIYNATAGTAARTHLGFSPSYQELHLGRFLVNGLADILDDKGTGKWVPINAVKGVARTVQDIVSHPTDPGFIFRKVGDLGLSQDWSVPWNLKKWTGPNGKARFMYNFGDIGNVLATNFTYEGWLSKLKKQGITGENAVREAVRQTKRTDLLSSPANAIKFLSDSGILGKWAGQFKQYPARFIEQRLDYLYGKQWNKVLWSTVGLALAYEVAEKTGVKLFHTILRPWGVPAWDDLKYVVQGVRKEFERGNIEGAMEIVGRELTPGGRAFRKERRIQNLPEERQLPDIQPIGP